jgi:hypothetical protein
MMNNRNPDTFDLNRTRVVYAIRSRALVCILDWRPGFRLHRLAHTQRPSHHGGHGRTDPNGRGKEPHNDGKKRIDTSSGKEARSG